MAAKPSICNASARVARDHERRTRRAPRAPSNDRAIHRESRGRLPRALFARSARTRPTSRVFPRTPSRGLQSTEISTSNRRGRALRTARRRRRRRAMRQKRFKEILILPIGARAPKTKMKAPPTSTHRQRAGRTQTDHSHPSIERPAVASRSFRAFHHRFHAHGIARRLRAIAPASAPTMSNHNLFARSVRARPPHPLSSIVCDARVAEGTNRLFRHPMPSARKCASAHCSRRRRPAHTRDASAPTSGVRDARGDAELL